MLKCLECAYYEAYHQHPNPNMYARHWCTKCKDEIYYDKGRTWLPKPCYFNHYFRKSEAVKKAELARNTGYWCQVE